MAAGNGFRWWPIVLAATGSAFVFIGAVITFFVQFATLSSRVDATAMREAEMITDLHAVQERDNTNYVSLSNLEEPARDRDAVLRTRSEDRPIPRLRSEV